MKIIPSHIATVTYNFGKPTSRSYITNLKTYYSMLLEDISSDFWYVIVNAKTDEEIINFAKQNGMENELEEIIATLVETGFLEEENILSPQKIPPPYTHKLWHRYFLLRILKKLRILKAN